MGFHLEEEATIAYSHAGESGYVEALEKKQKWLSQMDTS